MSLVAIIGAGEIGGAVARALAARARVDTVRLIDETGSVAAGKALDLKQSGPISGSDTRIEGANDVAAASGASVIVVADAADAGEWTGDAGLALLRRLARNGSLERAVLICAGAGQRVLMQQAFDELGLVRRRVTGSAPESLAATARAVRRSRRGSAATTAATSRARAATVRARAVRCGSPAAGSERPKCCGPRSTHRSRESRSCQVAGRAQ